jgi:hypothetical protein
MDLAESLLWNLLAGGWAQADQSLESVRQSAFTGLCIKIGQTPQVTGSCWTDMSQNFSDINFYCLSRYSVYRCLSDSARNETRKVRNTDLSPPDISVALLAYLYFWFLLLRYFSSFGKIIGCLWYRLSVCLCVHLLLSLCLCTPPLIF